MPSLTDIGIFTLLPAYWQNRYICKRVESSVRFVCDGRRVSYYQYEAEAEA